MLAICAALLGLALFRILSPREGATRRISVEAVEVRNSPIKSGESLTQEASWTPPDDVFIVGWAPSLGASGARAKVYLVSGQTTIFAMEQGIGEPLPTIFLPSGTGYLVRKSEPVRLRLQINNSGPEGETGGARALIYFHPVAWR